MIVPLHESFAPQFSVVAEFESEHAVGLNVIYRFQHDHVQRAAYSLIEDERQHAVHLSVGRLILAHATAEELDQQLIEIVGHLNEGRRLIDDPIEREKLARLNLSAGIRSQRSAAYEMALNYLRVGLELLPMDSWASNYDLTMALAIEYQQCAYLTTRYAEAESWIELMLLHAHNNLEKAEILSMRTRQYATTGKMRESIRTAIAGLALLGMRVSESPDEAAIQREKTQVKRNLAGRQVADLIRAPSLKDRAKIVTIKLLMEIFPAAFLSGSGNLFPFLVLKSVNISLRSGTSPESAFAYAAYGMLLCGILDDPALGYEFGKLAVAMNDKFEDIALKSRIIYLYTMFIHHWTNHWSSMTHWFRKGIESGYQSGDLLYLAYSAQDCVIWDPKLDLETATREHAEYLNIVRDCRYQDSLDSGTLFLQMQRNFLGLTDSVCSLNAEGFEEQQCIDGMRRRRFMTGIANYHIYKMEIYFLYGQYSQALTHVREQERLTASVMSLPQLVRYYIIAFLTLAACLPGMKSAERRRTRKRMRIDLKRMARWAAHCPVNFLHLQLLMEAELARLDGRDDAALRLYDQAMNAARAHDFRRDEAMINELAARHLLTNQRRKPAEGYLRAARQLYEHWGARRKVEQLEAEFSHLLTSHNAKASPLGIELRLTTMSGIGSAELDLASVMKASRAISSEVVLGQLWPTTMRVMLENAGGQRGCFIVRKDERLVIEGLCEVGRDMAAPARSIPLEEAAGTLALPISVVYHVLHTNNPIVLKDAPQTGYFAKDGYLLARKPKSILCLPLHQGEFKGAIYMENQLTSGVFTEDRVEIIKLLAAQVSVSVENAMLYANQQHLIDGQRRFIPNQFLDSLQRHDIAHVEPGEHVSKTMSLLFADIRNFTPLAERLDPGSVMDLLNQYFVSMEPKITQSGGFIDSFSGDEIKAIFNTYADAPIRAGIEMWRALDELNRHFSAVSQPKLQIGIGISTGPVVLGVVGGPNRMQCTCIGDTANLASRIEQLTKLYRARLLISEHTFRRLTKPEAFATRMIDRVAVKGKTTPIELYEVMDAETPARRDAKLATRHLLDSAIESYHSRQFEIARVAFEEVSSKDPDDVVPIIFAERCVNYLLRPPPEDWGGFEYLDHK
jgi:class 3 adenylate cyclase/GAF domain-containing protein